MVQRSGSNSKIAIVGGGILGMTLALRLSQKGFGVTVFEAAADIGGLASSWQIGDITWDKFYHVILMSDTYTRNILKELDLEKDIQWRETRTGFYTDGNLYSMSNTLEFLKFPPLNIFDKFRLGLTIYMASKRGDWQKLEKIPVETWLRKWSGDRTFNKIWLPLLRSKLGENYKDTSAAFIWATIQRMYAARQAGLKKEMFGYVQGGYARILQEFEKKLTDVGVEIQKSTQIREVIKNGSGIGVRADGGMSYNYDKVIITLPSPIAAQICPELTDTERTKLKGIRYLGVICTSLLLKKSLSPFYVTNITDSDLPFTGIIEMSSLVDKEQFQDKALVYLPKYLAAEDPDFKLTDEQIKQRHFSGLQKIYPYIKNEDVITSRVGRAKWVFALSVLNYSRNLTSMKTSIAGLYLINSTHIINGTLNINEIIKLAVKKGIPNLEL